MTVLSITPLFICLVDYTRGLYIQHKNNCLLHILLTCMELPMLQAGKNTLGLFEKSRRISPLSGFWLVALDLKRLMQTLTKAYQFTETGDKWQRQTSCLHLLHAIAMGNTLSQTQ